MSPFCTPRPIAKVALLIAAFGLSGCFTDFDNCGCGEPIPIPIPEALDDLVAFKIEDIVLEDGEDGEDTLTSWPNALASPFSDVLEMNATWEEGTLIVDYTTEKGDFRAIFETERSS